jgi:hypothetical protein
MRYIKFRPDPEILGAADLLVHAIRVYDMAGTIAAENRDFEKLLIVGDKINDVSDRLIAMSLHEAAQQEEHIIGEEYGKSNGEFGFTVPAPPTPSDGGCGEESE